MTRHLSMLLLPMSLLSACMVGGEDDGGTDDLSLANGGGTVAIKIVQHNVEKKIEAINNALHVGGTDGITLEEVCPVDLKWLHDNFDSKWTIGSVSSKKPARTLCDLPNGGHDIPNSVVIWKGGTGGVITTYPVLTAPAGAPGEMVCVQWKQNKVPVHLCAAHLISATWTDTDPEPDVTYNGEDLRQNETTKIKQITRDWLDKDHFVIVAGDFNAEPDQPSLDKLYDGQLHGSGDFTEYNRSGGSRVGRDTAKADGSNTEDGLPYSKKIDYVFFSTNRAPIEGAPVDIQRDTSDHHMVTSVASMKKR